MDWTWLTEYLLIIVELLPLHSAMEAGLIIKEGGEDCSLYLECQ